MIDESPERRWRRALGEGRFLLQRPRGGGAAIFPPRLAMPGSGDGDLEWIEASGHGTVHSVTVIHPRPPEPPRAIVLIDLDEGARLMSRVEGIAPAAVTIGLKVRARIGEQDGAPILLFAPA